MGVVEFGMRSKDNRDLLSMLDYLKEWLRGFRWDIDPDLETPVIWFVLTSGDPVYPVKPVYSTQELWEALKVDAGV